MAYLDVWKVATEPLWWTTAIYQRTSSGGYVARGYAPLVRKKWQDFHAERMQRYPVSAGYATYDFYWDPLAGQWMRDKGKLVSGAIDTPHEERRNPLPPGRYWIDVIDTPGKRGTPQWPPLVWDNWSSPKVKDGSVVIDKFEHFRANPLLDGSWIPDFLKTDEERGSLKMQTRTWLLFTVTRPVEWPSVQLGFPTIATADVRTSDDTVSKPAVPSISEEFAEDVGHAVSKVVTPVLWAGGLYLGIKLVLALRSK